MAVVGVVLLVLAVWLAIGVLLAHRLFRLGGDDDDDGGGGEPCMAAPCRDAAAASAGSLPQVTHVP